MDKILQAREFHETHKMKIGRDYRLEFLKLSKEDIYDFLETKYGDYSRMENKITRERIQRKTIKKLIERTFTNGRRWI